MFSSPFWIALIERTMNSLPSEKATEKIVYLQVTDYNQRLGERKLRGFASAYQVLQDIFERTLRGRYLKIHPNREGILFIYTNLLTVPTVK